MVQGPGLRVQCEGCGVEKIGGYPWSAFGSPVGSSSPSCLQGSGFRVQGAGCRVQGAGCRVQGPGFKVQGSGFRVQGPGFRVQGSGIRVHGSRCTLPGSRLRVQGAGLRVSGAHRENRQRVAHPMYHDSGLRVKIPPPGTLNPQIRNPHPSNLNPEPSFLNPQIQNPHPSILKSVTLNPQPGTLDPQLSRLGVATQDHQNKRRLDCMNRATPDQTAHEKV